MIALNVVLMAASVVVVVSLLAWAIAPDGTERSPLSLRGLRRARSSARSRGTRARDRGWRSSPASA